MSWIDLNFDKKFYIVFYLLLSVLVVNPFTFAIFGS